MSLRAFCCFMLFLSCGTQEAPAPQSGSFEALTYNVAGLPEGLSSSHPEVYMPQISPLLNSYDLVLVQEDFTYHHELVSELEHPHPSPAMDISESESLMTDGLNRFSQFSFSEYTRTKWVACFGGIDGHGSDCLADKGFTFAVHDLGEEVPVHIYNFHAEAGGGEEDNTAREKGYEQLIEYILTHSNEAAVIVGADTNLHGNDPADEPVLINFMEQTKLADVCRTLECGNEQIDRFFFRNSSQLIITPTFWEIAPEFVTEEGSPLSDHPAIHVTFEWQENETQSSNTVASP